MDKKDLRKFYKDLRSNIINKSYQNRIIYDYLINYDKLNNSDLLLFYVSLKDEVDTTQLINYFINKKKIAVPKVENNIINFYIINSLSDLNIGPFNILEPISNNKVKNFSNSVCITPGICFDKEGYRIGYGKGFYDRFFSNHNTYSIGLSFDECITDNIPCDEIDHKLDEIISPKIITKK